MTQQGAQNLPPQDKSQKTPELEPIKEIPHKHTLSGILSFQFFRGVFRRRSKGDGTGEIDIRATIDYSSDRHIDDDTKAKLNDLIATTNLLERTLKVLHGKPMIKKDIKTIGVSHLGSGSSRSAHEIKVKLADDTEYSFALKIANFSGGPFDRHQILGRFLEPSREVSTMTTGIWRLQDGRIILTEEVVRGKTYEDLRFSLNDHEMRDVQRGIISHSIGFWDMMGGVFIQDPHREQYNIYDRKTLKSKIVDAGDVLLQGDIRYNIPNTGEVFVYDEKDNLISDITEIAQKMPPKKLIKLLIFHLESPGDREATAEYMLEGRGKQSPLHRPSILLGVIDALGPERASQFLKDAKGADRELDAAIDEFEKNPNAYFFARRWTQPKTSEAEAVTRMQEEVGYSTKFGMFSADSDFFSLQGEQMRGALNRVIKHWHTNLALSYEWFPPADYPRELLECIDIIFDHNHNPAEDSGTRVEKRIKQIENFDDKHMRKRSHRQTFAEMMQFNPIVYARYLRQLEDGQNPMVAIDSLKDLDQRLQDAATTDRWKKLWAWGERHDSLPTEEQLNLQKTPQTPKIPKQDGKPGKRPKVIDDYYSVYNIFLLGENLQKQMRRLGRILEAHTPASQLYPEASETLRELNDMTMLIQDQIQLSRQRLGPLAPQKVQMSFSFSRGAYIRPNIDTLRQKEREIADLSEDGEEIRNFVRQTFAQADKRLEASTKPEASKLRKAIAQALDEIGRDLEFKADEITTPKTRR